MNYIGSIFRPPSEAYSLILQVTVGCSHNKCTFCGMYKEKNFKVKPIELIKSDLAEARRHYKYVERIFFADGDALCLKTDKLLGLFELTRSVFPECKRMGLYSRALNILSKSEDELRNLKEAGLGIVYIGAESGSDEVLKRVNKGETVEEIIRAVHKAESCGIKTSVTFISGLGGKELMKEHAVETGEMISKMNASYVGLLTLLLDETSPLNSDVRKGTFVQLEPLEVINELEMILENSNCTKETVFRSNHASNWLVLKGTLPKDKPNLLEQVRFAKENAKSLRHESYRRL